MTEEQVQETEATEETEAVEEVEGTDDTTTEDPEVKEPEAPKATVKNAIDGGGREPNPESKKGKMFYPGRTEEGGSIKAMTEEFGCTLSNIRQHIAQCHTNLGFGYKIVGDRYWITGEVHISWDDQKAEKDAAAAKKEAAKKAKEEAAAKAKAEAEAKAKAEAETDPVPESDGTTTEPPQEELDEDDDFLE